MECSESLHANGKDVKRVSTAFEFLNAVKVSATTDRNDFKDKMSTQWSWPGESHARPG